MIVTYDDIIQGRDISDHEHSSDESEEEKIGGESEVEEGSDNCYYEERADVYEDEKQLQ